jgi:putative ABC transport system ATP-binding protein
MSEYHATPDCPLMIDASGVRKSFDHGKVVALDGVDLQVAAGDFVAITGPSGCGKSTLLHLIAALDRADAGRIVVDGRDLDQLHSRDDYRRNEVGLVFQLHNLLPHLDARRNVEIAMLGGHRRRADRQRHADELLHDVGLTGREHRHPTELSGGERQRIAIARALANEPPLLLADEPTGSLDTEAVDKVLGLFHRIRAERRLTILMVTHDQGVAGHSDRVVHMRDGKVVDRGLDVVQH